MTCTITVDACLIDLYGTIVDTVDEVEEAWEKLGHKHGIDTGTFPKHGRRASDALKESYPNANNQMLVRDFEKAVMKESANVRLIPGASDLLLSLDRPTSGSSGEVFKVSRWGIVTSATRRLANSWFDTILKKVGKPDVLVTGDDVQKGKPDPECYLLARKQLAERMGMDEEKMRCLVIEDSSFGIAAGKAMGAITVGVASTESYAALYNAGADYVLEDLTEIYVMKNSVDSVTLELPRCRPRTNEVFDEEDEETSDEDQDNDDDDDVNDGND